MVIWGEKTGFQIIIIFLNQQQQQKRSWELHTQKECFKEKIMEVSGTKRDFQRNDYGRFMH